MSNLELADKLNELCCAETEGKFFDLVTDSVQTIIAALRSIDRITAERDALKARVNAIQGGAERYWEGRYHDATVEGDAAEASVDVLERNARIQAKLLADTGRERDRFRAALEKVRSYNVDIHAGRINYRPWDHIQVIDLALTSTPPLSSDESAK